LQTGTPIVAPGAASPLVFRLIQQCGFEAAYLGGYDSGVQLGIPEPMVSLTDQAQLAFACTNGLGIPVIIDGGAGWGDAAHTMRSVRELERAGVAAIHIEDQIFPKRVHYHRDRGSQVKRVIPLDEHADKIRMALAARRDPNTLIIARTDAGGAVDGGVDEAIRRCRRYSELGVDAVMPLVHDLDHMKTIRRAIDPGMPMAMALAPGSSVSLHPIAELAASGVQLILVAHLLGLAAMNAQLAVLQGMRAGRLPETTADRIKELRTMVYELIDMPEYIRIEEETTEKRRTT
jgi:methylisocitrate lyase